MSNQEILTKAIEKAGRSQEIPIQRKDLNKFYTRQNSRMVQGLIAQISRLKIGRIIRQSISIDQEGSMIITNYKLID
jgi:hypothetical protein